MGHAIRAISGCRAISEAALIRESRPPCITANRNRGVRCTQAIRYLTSRAPGRGLAREPRLSGLTVQAPAYRVDSAATRIIFPYKRRDSVRIARSGTLQRNFQGPPNTLGKNSIDLRSTVTIENFYYFSRRNLNSNQISGLFLTMKSCCLRILLSNGR